MRGWGWLWGRGFSLGAELRGGPEGESNQSVVLGQGRDNRHPAAAVSPSRAVLTRPRRTRTGPVRLNTWRTHSERHKYVTEQKVFRQMGETRSDEPHGSAKPLFPPSLSRER